MRSSGVGEEPDPAQEVSVRDPGCNDDHLSGSELFRREDTRRVLDPEGEGLFDLAARRRPELRLQLPPDSEAAEPSAVEPPAEAAATRTNRRPRKVTCVRLKRLKSNTVNRPGFGGDSRLWV